VYIAYFVSHDMGSNCMACVLQTDKLVTPALDDLELTQSAAAEHIVAQVNAKHSCTETSYQVVIFNTVNFKKTLNSLCNVKSCYFYFSWHYLSLVLLK